MRTANCAARDYNGGESSQFRNPCAGDLGARCRRRVHGPRTRCPPARAIRLQSRLRRAAQLARRRRRGAGVVPARPPYGSQVVQDLPAWLATITFRLALDRRRKPEPLDIADFDFPSLGPDAEHTAIRRQQVERLQRLIVALPDDLRHALVLSAVDDLNSRQIGEVLGIPESSVRGRIARARQMLKEKLTATEAKP